MKTTSPAVRATEQVVPAPPLQRVPVGTTLTVPPFGPARLTVNVTAWRGADAGAAPVTAQNAMTTAARIAGTNVLTDDDPDDLRRCKAVAHG